MIMNIKDNSNSVSNDDYISVITIVTEIVRSVSIAISISISIIITIIVL